MTLNIGTPLPRFLEKRADGEIVMRGHRVKLFAVLEVIGNSGEASAIKLQERFPSIPAAVFEETLSFCSVYSDQVEEFYKEQLAVAEQNRSRLVYTGPSIGELRQRQKIRQQSEGL